MRPSSRPEPPAKNTNNLHKPEIKIQLLKNNYFAVEEQRASHM